MTVTYSEKAIYTARGPWAVPWFIYEFWDEMDSCPDEFEPEIWATREIVETAFREEDLVIDVGLAENYFKIEKYFPYDLIPFQRCAFSLWACVFHADSGQPRWPDLFIMAAR